jgi:hypothetical protein
MVEHLNATTGHGASRLPSIAPLNKAIHITNIDRECFDISARILVSGKGEREIDLSRTQLKLVK